MIFNTSHLGFKLLSGNLKERRVHSEQLNKFVAGYFDSDGYITYYITAAKAYVLKGGIAQSGKVDTDGRLLKALKDFYGIGRIYYNQKKHMYYWEFERKEAKKFYNIIGKHLIVKQKHYQSMIDFYDNKQSENLDKLRTESRKASPFMTHKKHISPAYLAGFIAGDGYVRVRIDKQKGNRLCIVIKLHVDDVSILEAIKTDYGGKMYFLKNVPHVQWELNLNVGNPKAVETCKTLRKYLCLDYKYEALGKIIEYHKQRAETKRLKLEESMR